jgi:hypothetical protein
VSVIPTEQKGMIMGKNSKSNPYSAGGVSVNGQSLAGNWADGNNIFSSYNMSDNEKNLYDYIGNSLVTNVPNINVFSEDVQTQLQNQLGAYTNQGLKLINNTYTPMLSNLKNDIANRFGNFDNSVFMDNLNSIENRRADSMSSLTQDILAKQNELYNDELSRRYNYLSFIGGLQQQMEAKVMDYLGIAAQNSTMGNTYNANQSKIGSTNSGFNTSALISNLTQQMLQGLL